MRLLNTLETKTSAIVRILTRTKGRYPTKGDRVWCKTGGISAERKRLNRDDRSLKT